MHAAHDFEVAAPPVAVAGFLGDPLNIGVSNRPGRVVGRSDDGATQAGSWAIVEVGNIRSRIEYLVFDPPREVTVSLVQSRPGSADVVGTWRYSTTEEAAGGSQVRVEIESPDRATDLIGRLLLPIMWWQLGRHLSRIGTTVT